MTVHLRDGEFVEPPTSEQVRKALEMAAQTVLQSWTRRANARDAGGRPVHPVSPDAVCWCANGALVKAAAELTGNNLAARQALVNEVRRWLRDITNNLLVMFNDYEAEDAEHVGLVLEMAAEAY